MTETEGVIQYRLDYRPGPLPADFDPGPLLAAFRRCRTRGLIGQHPARYGGYAYGNLSVRANQGFVISGTQTAGTPALSPDQLAWVTRFDSVHDTLVATGPARPSSEAMSHGEVYAAAPAVAAIIHAHSPVLWQNAQRLDLPTTDPAAATGTLAMAHEVGRLLADNAEVGVLAMGGHEDGIIVYAGDMQRASDLLFESLAEAEAE